MHARMLGRSVPVPKKGPFVKHAPPGEARKRQKRAVRRRDRAALACQRPPRDTTG